MSLAAGTCLGPYEIVAPLGAGGMGEVYRARDTRLGRTVALKVLRSLLAPSTEQRLRFEREARAISALSHPHICVLHDVGQHEGIDFLVMEYLEGQTLAARLANGPLPLEQVLRYGTEIADALDRAHCQEIVHRDLKPGNVMLTKGGTKLLDFGIAKLLPSGAYAVQMSDLSALPTAELPLTETGQILGTCQYMAPEQLEGREPDARTDIFALGSVIYEMAAGQRAFSGSDRATLAAAILTTDPVPISTLQPLTPPALGRVVGICLAKDPEDRWQSARDLASELRWIAEAGIPARVSAPVQVRPGAYSRFAWPAAALILLLASIVLWWKGARPRDGGAGSHRVRFEFRAPERETLVSDPLLIAVSPDGERIAFTAWDGTTSHLYVRALDSPTATRISGTEDGFGPFWSPDGRHLGFVAAGKLKRIDLSGARTGALRRPSVGHGQLEPRWDNRLLDADRSLPDPRHGWRGHTAREADPRRNPSFLAAVPAAWPTLPLSRAALAAREAGDLRGLPRLGRAQADRRHGVQRNLYCLWPPAFRQRRRIARSGVRPRQARALRRAVHGG
jgi:eukaryotic-like serine/threonine-protein kinase